MELLAIIFVWPFLLLAFALVFIALEDLALGSAAMLILGTLVLLIFFVRSNSARGKTLGRTLTSFEQLQNLRGMVVMLSIAFLLPIFVRYLFDSFENSLSIILVGLAIGFGFTLWGMFTKGHRVLMMSSVIGGALTLLYVYTQLWDLGEGARIIAAAVGLIVAVAVSTVKLKEKLT